MAAITYLPPPGGPTGPLEVRTDTMIFTFEPGVPKYVFEEDRAALITAITTAVASSTATVTNTEL